MAETSEGYISTDALGLLEHHKHCECAGSSCVDSFQTSENWCVQVLFDSLQGLAVSVTSSDPLCGTKLMEYEVRNSETAFKWPTTCAEPGCYISMATCGGGRYPNRGTSASYSSVHLLECHLQYTGYNNGETSHHQSLVLLYSKLVTITSCND